MSITVPDQLYKRMDDYNKEIGVPKSTLIQMAVTQYLDGQKMLESLPSLMTELKNAIEQKQLDEDFKPMSAEDKADLWKTGE